MEACVAIQMLKSEPPWILFFFSIGVFFILRSSFVFLNWIYVSFLRPPKNLKKYGSWALITGPTEGIGKAFAFELARKGMNLILVGRNSDKLKQVSFSIQSRYPEILVKIIVIDFTGDIDDGIKTIGETLDGLEIGVLINNVGVSYPYAKYFHELDEETLRNLIRVNVDGTTRVTQAVIHRMVARKKGAIVNLGSGAATVIPSDPLYSVYAATKAYIDQFSRSLYVEYKKSGIDVQCQVPLYVATRMASIRRSSFFVPSTETYARDGVRRIGYEPRCTPYWPHSILWCLASLIPDCAIDCWRIAFCLRIRHKGQLKDSIKNE